MPFNSFTFLLFFPLVFIVHWAMPPRWIAARNVWLLVASCAFYAYADTRFLLLLLAVTVTTFVCCKAIMSTTSRRWRKLITAVGITLLLAVLATFKYLDFFAESFASLLSAVGMHADVFTLNAILPIGLSFYVFMAISCITDTYRGGYQKSSNLLEFATYLCFFPHLLAGPIDRARLIVPQLRREREFAYDKVVDGCRQLLYGLFKKVVIADSIGGFVDGVWAEAAAQHSIVLIAALVLYSVQIYADFSGYSDMALGLGRMLGVEMMRNFRFPYFSRTISEFWRNWHISLTSWFTEYVYIPLGGNRCGRVRTIRNTVVVFTLCGLWHGANWTYVVWGLYNGLLFIPLILHPEWKRRWQDSAIRIDVANAVSIVLTFGLVTAGWWLFRAPSLPAAWSYLLDVLHNWSLPLTVSPIHIECRQLWALLAVAFVLTEWRGRDHEYGYAIVGRWPGVVRWATYVGITVAVLFYTLAGGGNFIYSNF